MNKTASHYFWLLHLGVSLETLQDYSKEISDGKNSSLAQMISLLEAEVPVCPTAYVRPSFFAEATPAKSNTACLQELSVLIDHFEEQTHLAFNGTERPMLLAVRSSYAGVIRNIGITPSTLPALVHACGAATAYALYIDFLESYATTVLGANFIDFRKTFRIKVSRDGLQNELAEETEDGFLKKVRDYQKLISQKVNRTFPDRPEQQLLHTILHFGHLLGKSGSSQPSDEVCIQFQPYLSFQGRSVRGVAYTRNPFSGGKDTYGVFQWGSEGKKAPLGPSEESGQKVSLKSLHPDFFFEVGRHLPRIEAKYCEVMEVEFITDPEGRLLFCQFEKAETTARASVVSAIDLNKQGLISDREAVLRFKPKDVEMLLHPTLEPESKKNLKSFKSTGVTAAPGTAVGHVFYKMKNAIEFHKSALKKKLDARIILITDELSIADTPGLGLINGLVTKASGIASHAAVMARANGIPCIVGYQGLEVNPRANECKINGRILKEKTLITLEAGIEGHLFVGEGTLSNVSFQEGLIQDVVQLVSRVVKKENIPLDIRVNINNPKDAEVGLHFGAVGVGLCRTENMFMAGQALKEIRNIIFTQNKDKCKQSFKNLEELQFADFKRIFQVMQNRVVNIRLMDLPLHDFVPQSEEDFHTLAHELPHLEKAHLRLVADNLREHNPMLGLRACRFGLISPEVYDLQIKAIVRAAYEAGNCVNPGIMFPLVLFEAELATLKDRVLKIEAEIREKLEIPEKGRIVFRVGSMIELPAAALGADRLARIGEFFAFGTNDLTQTTLGMSRDDSAHYLPHYLEKGFLDADPFKALSEPVKELIEMAVSRGRRVRPDASFGICGEQGGNIATIRFCLENGLDYISCSPFRVLSAQVSLIRVCLTEKIRAESNGFRTLSTSNKDASGPSLRLVQAG